MHTEQHIVEHLREKGHRMTTGRRWIIRIFLQNHKHLTAQDVHAMLSKDSIESNLSTVYRELQFLTEEGILSSVQFADGVQRYELNEDRHHHHLICTNCHAIQEVDMENDLNVIEKKIQQQQKFQVAHHILDFYGLCGKCA